MITARDVATARCARMFRNIAMAGTMISPPPTPSSALKTPASTPTPSAV
jgi:hypothetical protein